MRNNLINEFSFDDFISSKSGNLCGYEFFKDQSYRTQCLYAEQYALEIVLKYLEVKKPV